MTTNVERTFLLEQNRQLKERLKFHDRTTELLKDYRELVRKFVFQCNCSKSGQSGYNDLETLLTLLEQDYKQLQQMEQNLQLKRNVSSSSIELTSNSGTSSKPILINSIDLVQSNHNNRSLGAIYKVMQPNQNNNNNNLFGGDNQLNTFELQTKSSTLPVLFSNRKLISALMSGSGNSNIPGQSQSQQLQQVSASPSLIYSSPVSSTPLLTDIGFVECQQPIHSQPQPHQTSRHHHPSHQPTQINQLSSNSLLLAQSTNHSQQQIVTKKFINNQNTISNQQDNPHLQPSLQPPPPSSNCSLEQSSFVTDVDSTSTGGGGVSVNTSNSTNTSTLNLFPLTFSLSNSNSTLVNSKNGSFVQLIAQPSLSTTVTNTTTAANLTNSAGPKFVVIGSDDDDDDDDCSPVDDPVEDGDDEEDTPDHDYLIRNSRLLSSANNSNSILGSIGNTNSLLRNSTGLELVFENRANRKQQPSSHHHHQQQQHHHHNRNSKNFSSGLTTTIVTISPTSPAQSNLTNSIAATSSNNTFNWSLDSNMIVDNSSSNNKSLSISNNRLFSIGFDQQSSGNFSDDNTGPDNKELMEEIVARLANNGTPPPQPTPQPPSRRMRDDCSSSSSVGSNHPNPNTRSLSNLRTTTLANSTIADTTSTTTATATPCANINYFRCEQSGCDFVTNSRPTMVTHLRKFHQIQRPFQCNWPGCTAQFKEKYKLKVHLVVHTKEKPFGCKFPGCSARFSQSGHLSRHRKIHLPLQSQSHYPCSWPQCNRTFIQKHSLKNHLMLHRGEKPWKCHLDNCDRSFTEKWKLAKHQKAHIIIRK